MLASTSHSVTFDFAPGVVLHAERTWRQFIVREAELRDLLEQHDGNVVEYRVAVIVRTN